jgi:hypothetical protein
MVILGIYESLWKFSVFLTVNGLYMQMVGRQSSFPPFFRCLIGLIDVC